MSVFKFRALELWKDQQLTMKAYIQTSLTFYTSNYVCLQTNALRKKDISRVTFNKFTLNQWNFSINVAPLIPTFIEKAHLYKSVEVHISIANNSYSQRTARRAVCKARH